MKTQWARWFIVAFALLLLSCEDKEAYLALQREVTEIGMQIDLIEQSVEQGLPDTVEILEQALKNVTATNARLDILQTEFTDRLDRRRQTFSEPIAELSGTLDRLTEDLSALRKDASNLGAGIDRLQHQVSTLKSEITVIRPAPPGF
ncbi:MAG: hypothetical protein HUU41_03150 [Bryobacteraceae bacterium]|nr:hypothetical protein [Bryobacterales bacterium]MEB2363849.1 hypothetical protein [Bryobacterales bacterium]NUN00088.1 hypothetical protein [Bryobacteraceae bacterium]